MWTGLYAALGALLGTGLTGLVGRTEAKKKDKKAKRTKKCKKGKKGKKCKGKTKSPKPLELTCIGEPDGSRCADGKACSGEVCAVPPTCTSTHERPPNSNCDLCCAGVCISGFPDCGLGGPGDPCHVDDDCFGPGCVGFVCASP